MIIDLGYLLFISITFKIMVGFWITFQLIST